MAALARQLRRQCRAADATNALGDQRCAGQQCAGVACRNHGIRFAVLDHAQRHRHRRIFFAANSRRRIIVHINDFLCVMNGNRQIFRLLLCQQVAENRFLSDQNIFLSKFLGCLYTAGNLCLRCVVTAHSINDDFHERVSFPSCTASNSVSRCSSARCAIWVFFSRLPLTR